MKKYDPQKIERKWQKKWLNEKVFQAREDSGKPKYYQLETFPYPSAAGLHVGHPKGYIAEDIHARYKRMNGFDVLYTMGWDAFGLPTENYAIQVGKSPQDVAKDNIKNFKKQVQMFGLSYDWDREINTSDPKYYKWTQWLFVQLFKAGLAYRAKANINWCPKDQTVLANEQVINGRCFRDNELVAQKEIDQWFLKITKYADRLLEDLSPPAGGLDWPAASIKRQVDWIGRSEGAVIKFSIFNSQFSIDVFTTRPDTIYGATYLVLAPEHKIISNLKSNISNLEEVEKYIVEASHKTELMRQEEAKDKTGVELKGIKAINPANGEEISIWIADYVLAGYGTGAIMAVPQHDERDREFAEKFNLPIVDKPLVDKNEIIEKVGGKKTVNYKLRDWSVGRQRYWGVPIPMIHCGECGIVPVPEEELPVELPKLKDYRPQGMPPLASSDKFLRVKCPTCGDSAQRDPETLDTFVDSSWYYLRYADPHNDALFASPDKLKHWLPVDLYVIGAEHTVLHLLYSRFITKFLYDQGYLKFDEPFLKLRHLGLILGHDGHKMSKSKGNVVNPDELVEQFGADAVRLYEMFMGPFDDGQPWDSKGVVGTYRFLNRIWALAHSKEVVAKTQDLVGLKLVNVAIHNIEGDIVNLHFNTAVSWLMKTLNNIEDHLAGGGQVGHDALEIYLKLLAPLAPHMAQEIWTEVLGKDGYIHFESWPKHNPELVIEESIGLPVQINGKVREVLRVLPDISEHQAKELALASENVKKHLAGQSPKKIIYIPKKMISIVI